MVSARDACWLSQSVFDPNTDPAGITARIRRIKSAMRRKGYVYLLRNIVSSFLWNLSVFVSIVSVPFL